MEAWIDSQNQASTTPQSESKATTPLFSLYYFSGKTPGFGGQLACLLVRFNGSGPLVSQDGS